MTIKEQQYKAPNGELVIAAIGRVTLKAEVKHCFAGIDENGKPAIDLSGTDEDYLRYTESDFNAGIDPMVSTFSGAKFRFAECTPISDDEAEALRNSEDALAAA